MKKIMFLFLTITCVSSMNYGMNPNINKEENDSKEILDNISKTNNDISMNIPYPKKAERPNFCFSFIMNLCVGAITKHYNVSNKVRAGIFLAANISYGCLNHKKYVEYAQFNINNEIKGAKSANTIHIMNGIFGFTSHLIGNYGYSGIKSFILHSIKLKIQAWKSYNHQ